jgi:hypothetical protein
MECGTTLRVVIAKIRRGALDHYKYPHVVPRLRQHSRRAESRSHGRTSARARAFLHSALHRRYLTKADDLRHELNAYAAELETMDTEPNHGMLMERVIQTQQMFTIDKPANSAEGLCEVLAKWLAVETEGIIQIDGRGWLNAAGELLLREF